MIVMTYDTTLMVFRNPVNSPVEEKVEDPIISTIQQGQFFVGLGPANFGILGIPPLSNNPFAKGILSESQTTNSPLAVKKFAGNRCFNLTPEMGWKTLLQKMWGSWGEEKIARGFWCPFSLPWKKNRWMFWWWWSMGFLAANQSKKVLENSAKCSQETRNSLCRNTLSVVLTSIFQHMIWRGRFKSQKPCTFGTEDKKSIEILHPRCSQCCWKTRPMFPKKRPVAHKGSLLVEVR